MPRGAPKKPPEIKSLTKYQVGGRVQSQFRWQRASPAEHAPKRTITSKYTIKFSVAQCSPVRSLHKAPPLEYPYAYSARRTHLLVDRLRDEHPLDELGALRQAANRREEPTVAELACKNSRQREMR